MQRHTNRSNHNRPGATASQAAPVSGPEQQNHPPQATPIDPLSSNHPSRHPLIPKPLLNSEELCSRFEQVSGKGQPKRLSSGKFVTLRPAGRLPDGLL